MQKPLWKRIAAISIIVLTVAAFIVYFINNPTIWHELKTTPPRVFASVVSLYLISIGALALVTITTLRLCKLVIPFSESLLLTMYTAIVNFFGPLQSGPAFRGVYLKQKHNLKLSNYAVSTSVYYFFWGGISVLMLFSGILKWWLIPMIGVGLFIGLIIERSKKYGRRFNELDLRGTYLLIGATLLQIVIVSFIYFVELRSVSPGVHYSQVIIYTGAANLALFVSLTPGAVGFREAFLVFSQNLHHISTSAIVAANTIDRAMYFVVLGILSLYVFGSHARQKLGVKKPV